MIFHNHGPRAGLRLAIPMAALVTIMTGCVPAYDPPQAETTDLALARFEQGTLQPQRTQRMLADEAAMVMRVKQKLQPAAQPLCIQNGRPRCHFRIALIDNTSVVNASASGNSQIDIYRGLVQVMPGDAELAFIVAHEMGHHIANHLDEDGMRSSIIEEVGSLAFGVAGFLMGASISTINTAMKDGRKAASGIALTSFSLRDEYEADYIGIYVMMRAGYDPKAAIRAMDYLSAISKQEGGGTGFLKTHPDDDDRSARLRRALIEIDEKKRTGQPLIPNG